jgi:hypothetical protein
MVQVDDLTDCIFISYSRTDQAYARRLADELRERGPTPWMDDRIDFGDHWWQTIVRAVRASAAFIVVMTPEAERLRWVEREGKPILPLLLRGRRVRVLLSPSCVARCTHRRGVHGVGEGASVFLQTHSEQRHRHRRSHTPHHPCHAPLGPPHPLPHPLAPETISQGCQHAAQPRCQRQAHDARPPCTLRLPPEPARERSQPADHPQQDPAQRLKQIGRLAVPGIQRSDKRGPLSWRRGGVCNSRCRLRGRCGRRAG